MKSGCLKLHVVSSLSCFIGVATVLAVYAGNERIIETLTAEDGMIESLSAIFYFCGLIVCIYCLTKKLQGNRFWLFFWAFLCFIFLGEETSWFQRVFDYPAPLIIEDASAQKEFNFHNLGLFQGGKWIEAFSSGKFDLKIFFSSQNIFRIGFISYFLIIPLLLYAGKPKFLVGFLRDKAHYPNPRAGFLIAVWTTLCLSFVLAVYSNEQVRSSLAETREMFYALYILVYVYRYLAVSATNGVESRGLSRPVHTV